MTRDAHGPSPGPAGLGPRESLRTSVESRLLLVRHGQSTWNATGRWQGQADPPLSALGVAQARAASDAVPAGYEVVVTSDLERARHTAEILAAAAGLDPVADERLRERHAGPWQGLTRAEIDARWPGMLDDGRRPEGYECDDQLIDRTLPVLDALATSGEPAVVVTHGGVIRAIEIHLGAAARSIPNLAARVLEHSGGRWSLGASFDLAGTVPLES